MRALIAVCTHERGPLLNLDALARLSGADVAILDASRSSERQAEVRRLAARHGFEHVPTPSAGLSRQRNVAVDLAGSRALVFLDDDCVPLPGWLDHLTQALRAGADVATARVLTPRSLLSPWSRFFDQDHGPASRTFDADDLRVLPDAPFEPFAGDSGVAPWAVGTGSSFAMRPALTLETGGFREDLGVGSPGLSGEDIDLFFRVLHRGGTIRYVADACVEHHHVRREQEDYLRTAHGYGWGGRAFVWRALRAKPAYLAVLLGRPLQLLLLAAKSRGQGDEPTARMCHSAMRGWLGLPFQPPVAGRVSRGRASAPNARALR